VCHITLLLFFIMTYSVWAVAVAVAVA